MLPAALHHLLSGHGHGVSATVDYWLDNWMVIDADDDRIALAYPLFTHRHYILSPVDAPDYPVDTHAQRG